MKSSTGKHARNIQIPEEWLGRIGEALKHPDAPDSVSAWIRSAMKEKLDRVQTAKEMHEIEERQAATLTQILDILRRVDRAVQTHLALQDAINKAILTHLPEPADINDARQIGQRRYARVVEHAARAMAANGDWKANGHA